MKTITYALATLALMLTLSGLALAQDSTYKLTVVIPEINNRSGKLYVGIATDEATFKGKSFQTITVDVPAQGEVKVEFDKLTKGRYAVRMYQDLNGNSQIDYAGMMPTEPFGFSNITRLMGPPAFDDAVFDLDAPKQMTVYLMNQ